MKYIVKKISVVIIFILISSFVLPYMPRVNNISIAEAATTKLNKTKIKISVGETYQLNITGTKSKVKWSTNNKKYATVSEDGLVSGVKSGTAFITALVGDKSYTCKVMIMYPTLNKYNFTVRYGEKKQIIINNLPKQFSLQDVKWIPENENIVSIDGEGNITAYGEGFTNITVSFGEYKLRCTATVPSLTNEEASDFMNVLDYEHGKFNNQEVYIFKNCPVSVEVDYQIEFYDESDSLISVSQRNYMALGKGKETILYIDKCEKVYKYYKFRYNSVRGSYNANTNIINFADKLEISPTETYDYSYEYYDNSTGVSTRLKDTVKLFDFVVNNKTNDRMTLNVKVIYYKGDDIVDVKVFWLNNIDVGITTIKNPSCGYTSTKIYAPEYDKYRIIY